MTKSEIVEAVDRWSDGKDDAFLLVESEGGQCRIGFKASLWKEILFDIFKVEDKG